METSIFAFASDLLDEGVDTVLDNVQDRAGVGGVLLAAAYHDARDVFPHNPVRRVGFQGGGGVHFRPDPARWRGTTLQPRVSDTARETDPLAVLCEAGTARGLDVGAWAVFLHADRVDAEAGTATRNAFGDPYLTDLCPANPDVRAYVRALASDLARYEVSAIVAESLHYHSFEHGYHHERSFVPLGATTSFLLGLCFCEHCLALAGRYGVDADGVRRFAAAGIERALASGADEPGGEISRPEAEALAGGEMAGYLKARAEAVTSLVAEAAEEAAAEGVGFVFMDLSGAVKGYATGRPEGEPAASIAWRLGVDLAGVADRCDGLEALAYAREPARVRDDLEAYRRAAPHAATPAAALRPTVPDCDSTENLAAKIRAAGEAGAARVDFYHYGLAPLTALDRIREALDAARGQTPGSDPGV